VSTPDAPRPALENIVPILRVRSLKASIAWYAGILGFREDWHQPGVMASVSRDGRCLMLCENMQGAPGTWVWIGVTDARALHAEIVARGARVRMAPRNFSWAYEFHMQDPDGHVLRLGSGPLEGVPFDAWPSGTEGGA
jgi:catechol 2,3-dioxygenase-like lactoylglutathione lyase family enzyme